MVMSMFVLMFVLMFMSVRMTMPVIMPLTTTARMIVVVVQSASIGTAADIVVMSVGMVRSTFLVSMIMCVRISVFELQDFGFEVLDGGLQFGYICLNGDLNLIFRVLDLTEREANEWCEIDNEIDIY